MDKYQQRRGISSYFYTLRSIEYWLTGSSGSPPRNLSEGDPQKRHARGVAAKVKLFRKRTTLSLNRLPQRKTVFTNFLTCINNSTLFVARADILVSTILIEQSQINSGHSPKLLLLSTSVTCNETFYKYYFCATEIIYRHVLQMYKLDEINLSNKNETT